MTPIRSEPEYLTVKELIGRWRGQISATTLANWRSERKGPAFIKIGGRVLYPLADVIAYEAQSRRSNG
jgi:hypothetical protein